MLFTSEERQASLDAISAFVRGRTATLGLLLVGSGAAGYRDQYSDVDVLVVVRAAELAQFVATLERELASSLNAVFATKYQHHEEIYVLCLLLENGLEIDLAVWSSDVLFCASPLWRLLPAASSTDQASIERAMAESPRPTRWVPPVVSGDAKIWQFTYALIISILRRESTKSAREQLELYLADGGQIPARERVEDEPQKFLLALIEDRVPAGRQTNLLCRLVSEAYSKQVIGSTERTEP